ncbi:MAG: hypothetical protein JWN40_2226 [Phycisphaerales bacterium]|nr:hypothetical protein [Phycisphaerales bacterium]
MTPDQQERIMTSEANRMPSRINRCGGHAALPALGRRFGPAPGERVGAGVQPPSFAQQPGVCDPGGIRRVVCCCTRRYAPGAAAHDEDPNPCTIIAGGTENGAGQVDVYRRRNSVPQVCNSEEKIRTCDPVPRCRTAIRSLLPPDSQTNASNRVLIPHDPFPTSSNAQAKCSASSDISSAIVATWLTSVQCTAEDEPTELRESCCRTKRIKLL